MIKMMVNKLYNGQIFKNYKALCKELEIPVKSSSNSKDAQFKELECFCKFHKDGHKFVIDEVYEEPKEKLDGRGKSEGSKRSIYGNLIQLLITDLLAQCNGQISISRGWLMRSIGMTNSNYNFCGEKITELSKHIEMNEKVIYDFYNTNNSNFKSTIETALNNLMDKRVVMYNTIIKVVEIEKYSSPRNASELELKIIMDCEKDALDEFGYNKLSEIRTSKHWKSFKHKVKNKLGRVSNIKYYFTAYDITVNEKYIEKERDALINLLLEDAKREECKTELNQKVLENIVMNAQIRREKAKLFTSSRYTKFRDDDSYIDDIEKLGKLLIDKNTYNFTHILNSFNLDINALPYEIGDELDELFA